MSYEIATIPGDGIGPEVVNATLPLFEQVAENHGVEIEFTRYDWGSERHIEEGAMMPDDALDQL